MKNKKIESGCSLLAIAQFSCSVLFILFSFLSCNDPVFYEVSTQVKIPPPRIQGSPTAITQINNYMYVASGNIVHSYNTTNREWEKINPERGRISYLAATDTNLFILTEKGLFTSSEPNKASTYNQLSTGYKLLTMHFDNNHKEKVFVGARDSDGRNCILYSDGSDLVLLDINDDYSYKMLKGVAWSNSTYLLCVKDLLLNGGGIYSTDFSTNPPTATLINNSYNVPFMGIISLDGDNVIAITRHGVLYNVTDSSYSEAGFTTRKLSNGAMGICNAYNPETGILNGHPMLLVGRQDSLEYSTSSGYTYGYLEIRLNETKTGIESDALFHEPGRVFPSTLPISSSHNERFRTTLGKYPIKDFFQADDNYKTIFSSTQLEGLWSLKERDGRNYPYWNTEE